MIGPVQHLVSDARRTRRRGKTPKALRFALAALFAAGLFTPAGALDGADKNKLASTAQLPIFKDPQTALRVGLENYHAGNATTSIEALRYAAEGGESLAQWKLGRMYADGDGVARDELKAYNYFQRIVEHFSDDDPDPGVRSLVSNAFVSLGVYLRKGVAGTTARVAPDPERAFELFRYAATYFRNADAQYQLARMYLDGAFIKKDMRQALNWLDLAARKGHAQAQALIGQLMFDGAGGVGQRPRGLMYLTLARESAQGAAADQWIVDSHARALATASEAERMAAVAMLERYLKHRD